MNTLLISLTKNFVSDSLKNTHPVGVAANWNGAAAPAPPAPVGGLAPKLKVDAGGAGAPKLKLGVRLNCGAGATGATAGGGLDLKNTETLFSIPLLTRRECDNLRK